MNTIDRRNWLRTVGLSSGFTLISGLEGFARAHAVKTQDTSRGIKLSSNENPYGPSQKVRQAINNSLDTACRYPSDLVARLVQDIANKEGVAKECIVITGGSTEGLKATGITFALQGGEIIAANPTFDIMLSYAENFGAFAHRVPLNEKLEHDLGAMAARITNKTSIIFICNPNNPTGTLLEANVLKDFITSVDDKAIIFSDEAYYDYITQADYPSMVELVKAGRNVIVSKTFSKIYGLAGLRIGYLVARADLADRLKKNVMAMTNVLAINAAREALKDDAFYTFCLAKNYEAKNMVYGALDKLGLEYVRSHTNFVFFKTGRPIEGLITAMVNENIKIGRPFPPLTYWARVSTGKIEEVEIFTKALNKILG